MNGLLNTTGNFNVTLAVFLGILLLIIMLFLGRMKRYIDGAKAAGDEMMTLTRPTKTIIYGAFVYIFIAYFLNGHGICVGDVDLFSILVLAIGAINMSFDVKPQVLCENGIVTPSGLIPWELVKEIEKIYVKESVIVLRLDERMQKNTSMKVHCPSGETDKVVSIIESKFKN